MSTLNYIKKTIFEQVFGNTYQKAISGLDDKILLSTDSRNIQGGEIFFAISGEQYDGHDFIDEALKKGASLAVAAEDLGYQENPKILMVKNPLKTFQTLARLHLASFTKLKKIALTGSNGKTTTKEMIKAAIIKSLGPEKVFASFANHNNHIGVPQSALAISPQHEIAIFEMGMNHENEISTLCEIVRPDFGLITNIAHAHEGNFIDGIEGIEKAKGELFLSLDGHGHAIINLDDPRVIAQAKKSSFIDQTTYGSDGKAEVRLLTTEAFCQKSRRQRLKVLVKGKTFDFFIPIMGVHHAHNALAALATAYALKMDPREAAFGLENIKIPKGRMEFFNGLKGSILIHDGYNANPASMDAGFKSLFALKDFRRRIAVLASMAELGENSQKYHHILGTQVPKYFDILFAIGPERKHVIEGARLAKMAINCIYEMETSNEAIEPLKKFVDKGDLIFIKGSFSQNMQIIADSLKTP